MNSDKVTFGDWTWYTHHYKLLQTLPLSEYLGQKIPPFTIKSTEPIYYSMSFLLSRATHGNVGALAFVVSALVYIPLGLAISHVVRARISSPTQTVVVVFSSLLLGVTFTLTTQLVRQEIAAAFLCLGLVYLSESRPVPGGLLLLASVLTHNSALIPMAAVLIAFTFSRLSGTRRRLAVVLSLTGFLLVGVGVAHGFLGENDYTPGRYDGSVSSLVVLSDIAIFLTFLKIRKHLHGLGRLPDMLAFATLLHAVFLVGIYGQAIPFLRMYFYLEVFRSLLVACILSSFAHRRARDVLIVAPIIAICYFELRLASSPYQFHGDFIQHLTRPLL